MTSPQPNDASANDALNNTALNGDRGFLRSALSLMKPYWIDSQPKEKMIASALLAGAIGMTYLQVGVLSKFNDWQGNLGDTIQATYKTIDHHQDLLAQPQKLAALPEMEENKDKFVDLFAQDFPFLLGQYLLTVAGGFVCAQQLSLRWRKATNEHYLDKWLDGENKPYHRLQSIYKNTDNPDQRIQEDIKKLTDGTTSLATDAVGSVLSLATFSTTLWHLSGTFNPASFGGPDIEIQGLMFWAAVAYSGIGTYITQKVGKPLAAQDAELQKREANYRFNLVRTKERGKTVAMNGSENTEKNILRRAFEPVVEMTQEIINKRKQVLILQSTFNNLTTPAPYLMAAPLIFTGKLSYGDLMQTAGAFGRVSDAMNWFINTYQQRAELKSAVIRLSSFNDAIDKSNQDLADRRALPAPKAPEAMP